LSIRRPELTTPEQRTVIARKVVELVDAVNRLGDPVDLSEIEASITLLDTRVDDLEDRLGPTGSIFSMVGPGDAGDAVVAYDFTRATTIANANLSGDSSLDLTSVGTPLLDYFGAGIHTPHALNPFAAGVAGKSLFTGNGSHVTTSGSPAAVRQSGAMTAEWLGYVAATPTAGENLHLFFCAGSGETLAANGLYQLSWLDSDDSWHYVHETGAGTDSDLVIFPVPVAEFASMRLLPQMITLTRSSGGDINFYVNGSKVFDPQAAAPDPLPAGGTSADLVIGFVGGATTNGRVTTLGFRLFDVELTGAQARESYQRTFFGVAA
jgi:hypothetical protein